MRESGERRDIPRALDARRTQAPLVDNRDIERLEQGTRVLTEALLSRDQRIPMMLVFHLPLLQIIGESDIVVWADYEAGTFALEPFLERRDLLGRRFLPGNQVIEAENQQRVAIGEDSLVNRQTESGLVDALEHRDRMAAGFLDDFLKTHCRAVKKF